MRSQRQLRVGEELRHALSGAMREGKLVVPEAIDTAILTVTEVRVSPDLRNATVFIVPLGGGDTKAVVKTLNKHVGFFRHEIAKRVNLRQTPTLHFISDETFEEADKIEKLLHSPAVAKDLEVDADN